MLQVGGGGGCSGVSRGVFWLPGNPPGLNFFNQGDDTVTGTDPHQPITFATFGNPPRDQLWIHHWGGYFTLVLCDPCFYEIN